MSNELLYMMGGSVGGGVEPPNGDFEQLLTSGDAQAQDYMSRYADGVSLYGDTLIAGATGEDTGASLAGAAYIFTRTNDIWTQQQKIQASDRAANWEFGRAVAIYGDTVVVGAYANGNGAAYVFTRTGTTWTEQQKLTASDAQFGDRFGFSVSIFEDTIVVGAEYEDALGSNAGAAYVFTRTGTTWTEQQKLTASDAQSNDYFGKSVAIYGETIAVGAWQEDTGGSNAGAAYVFTRTGTTWTEQQKLTASDAQAEDYFGCDVSIFEDTIAVGAEGEDTGSTLAGAVYVFTRTATTWTEQQKLQASTPAFESLGSSVSIYGNSIVAGAPIGNGRSILFTTSDGINWTESSFSSVDGGGGTSENFGCSVAIHGSTFACGAYRSNSDAGCVYVFT